MNTRPRPPIVAGLATLAVVVSIALVWILAAARGGPSPATTASTAPSQVALASPSTSSSSPIGTSSPSASTPTASPAPKPTPAPVAAWSTPTSVVGSVDCSSVVAVIDNNGTDHLAAACHDNEVRYSTSTDGKTWTTTTFKPPVGRMELDPQLAFDGNTLYLAYTRVAPVEGGCGSNGLQDVGVYYRTRTLPGGDWSVPNRIGVLADHLQAFRASGTLHATVTNEKDGKTYYETLAGGTFHRYAMPDVAGWTSLRVGDDGKARVVYEGSKGTIQYGVFGTSTFATAPIPGSQGGWDPVLVLGPGNAAYALWNRSAHGGGCADGGPDPADGTYFGTNVSGTWVSTRLTTEIGGASGASLALDPATGDVDAVVAEQTRLVYFHKPAAGNWTHSTLVTAGLSSPVIRENPDTGALLVAYVLNPNEGSTSVAVMTRR